jgi:hypothetical protein
MLASSELAQQSADNAHEPVLFRQFSLKKLLSRHLHADMFSKTGYPHRSLKHTTNIPQVSPQSCPSRITINTRLEQPHFCRMLSRDLILSIILVVVGHFEIALNPQVP